MIQDPSNLNCIFELKKFQTTKELFEYSYSLFDNLIYSKDQSIVIMPGGTSPRDFFKLLLTKNFDWTQIEFVLSDERLVNVNNSKSNFRQINELFLNKLSLNKRPRLFPEMNKFKTLHKNKILSCLNKKYGKLPPISIAFLGIGVDGHIASIFKEDMFNLNSAPFFLTKRKEEKFSRLSISKNYLCSAKKIVFFLIGEKKQKLLRMIGKNKIDLPVNEIIKNAKGKVLVLTDLDIND